MGDRTTVTIYVPSALKEQATALFEGKPHEDGEDDGITFFVFDEVNYGSLDFLDALAKAGIAYDSCWNDGDEYGVGMESLRFDSEGNAINKEIYESGASPNMRKLLSLIDDHEKLKEFILKHQEEYSEMPWDNQVENGKIFLAKKLIS